MGVDIGAKRTSVIRLGAVNYLNARPLVHGLDQRTDLFALRFDPPSVCANLLHESSIDVGMIPSIEYCRGDDYRIAPGMGIISDGDVASVALFTSKPIHAVRSIAADTSSRTSNALLRILCGERFGIAPDFVPMAPDAQRMLQKCDAALIIGDPALYLDAAASGVDKIDLGTEWKFLSGLPFVWAFWAGRPDALPPAAVRALTEARDAGVAASDQVAAEYCGAERAAQGKAYLRDNIRYILGRREEEGLLKYYELAERYRLIGSLRPLRFYEA